MNLLYTQIFSNFNLNSFNSNPFYFECPLTHTLQGLSHIIEYNEIYPAFVNSLSVVVLITIPYYSANDGVNDTFFPPNQKYSNAN